MRRNRTIPLLLCLALGSSTASRGDDPKDARDVIRKGVEALGGEARLARCTALSYQARGKVHFREVPVAFEARFLCRQPSQYCLSFTSILFKATSVLDGDRGWLKLNDEVTEMSPERVAEIREELYLNRVVGLVALLKEEGFTLSLLGTVVIDGNEAVGIRVKHSRHRDVKLYLSTETWLPVKLQTRIVEDGKEMTQETFYGAYRAYNGARRPGRVVILRDRKPYSEATVSGYKALEKTVCDREIARARP